MINNERHQNQKQEKKEKGSYPVKDFHETFHLLVNGCWKPNKHEIKKKK